MAQVKVKYNSNSCLSRIETPKVRGARVFGLPVCKEVHDYINIACPNYKKRLCTSMLVADDMTGFFVDDEPYVGDLG